MQKIDLKKALKPLYQAPSDTVVEVDVPAMTFLMIDGEGDPNASPAYVQAVEALFSVSYATKFKVKKGPQAIDYGVMPLEGLWWVDDMARFSVEDKSIWKWTLMIMQPPFVDRQTMQDAIDRVAATRQASAPVLSTLRVESLHEGRCAQVMHIGPFSAEGPTIEKLHQFIAARGQMTGKHHEIYLSDIRRARPASWKTLIRQPMR